MPETVYPQVMAHAREDLSGNIEGQFSPEDWEKILARAAEQLAQSSHPEAEAWPEVVRQFHRERYWGFVPNYKKPKIKNEDRNLGKRFIWYTGRSFLITKVAILWFGARYAADYDPINKYLFFTAIGFMLISYGVFIWRFRNHKDE